MREASNVSIALPVLHASEVSMAMPTVWGPEAGCASRCASFTAMATVGIRGGSRHLESKASLRVLPKPQAAVQRQYSGSMAPPAAVSTEW